MPFQPTTGSGRPWKWAAFFGCCVNTAAENAPNCSRTESEFRRSGVATAFHVPPCRDRLPRAALTALEELEGASRDCARLHLRLALDYSSRWAIAQAAAALAKSVEKGTLAPEEISPELLQQRITNGTGDVDLLIRTAGEQRLSDFLLWETAYAEFHHTKVLWPDFRGSDLALAISDFRQRVRKFGALPKEGPVARVS